jgi:phosphoglycerol transferase MdoB-like AlkP superfamily enzyme
MALDRFMQGAIAGVAGAVVLGAWNLVFKWSGVRQSDIIDCAKSLLFDQPYSGFTAQSLGIVANILIAITFGVVFSFFMKFTGERYCRIKGVWYGLMIALVHNMMGIALSLPHFRLAPVESLIVMTSFVLYGFVIAHVWEKLDIWVLN